MPVDDTIDWASVRIHEPVRDAASEDERTYTEIMEDGLKVRDETKEVHQPGDEKSVDEIVAELKDKMDVLACDGALTDEEADRIMSALETIEARTGRIEKQLEALSA